MLSSINDFFQDSDLKESLVVGTCSSEKCNCKVPCKVCKCSIKVNQITEFDSLDNEVVQ